MIMDYEKLHKDTITKLQEMVNSGKITAETARGICADFVPESEEEGIRKELLNYLYDVHDDDEERARWIAWLEKQGEQKTADKVEPKFKVGDTIKLKDGDGLEWTVEEVHNNGYYTIVCADRDDFILLDDNWELVEQKPAWSEEDEKMIGNIRRIIEQYAFSNSAVDVNGELCEKEYIDADNFLKSLKERYTWRPSDEQMKVLSLCNVSGRMLQQEDVLVLKSLYEDLKVL